MKNLFRPVYLVVVLCWIGVFWGLKAYELQDSINTLNDLLFLGLLLFIPLLLPFLHDILPLVRNLQIKGFRIEFEEKVEEVEEKIEEEKKRLDQITNSHKSTLHSLAGLVITDPWKNPVYTSYISRREKKNIIIGCQEYTEQLLLCAIIARLLKVRSSNGFNVLPKYDFGGVNLNFIALSRGDIDIYPAYTWQGFEIAFATSLLQTADQVSGFTAEESIEELNKIFGPLKHPFLWLGYLGYYNNFEIVMRTEMAREYKVKKISDLRRLPDKFTFGCDPDFFGRPNGYELLKSEAVYGIRFKEVQHFDHEDKYQNIEKGNIDIIDGFTTDPHLDPPSDYIALEDDKSVFGKYYSSIIVRSQLAETYPEIKEILNILIGQIDVNDIRDMIREADRVKENQTAKIEQIAEGFLEKKGLI